VADDVVFEKKSISKDHVVSIRNGAVSVTGNNGAGQRQVPAGAKTNIIATASGHSHIIALTGDGKVIGWGYAVHGQLDVCKESGKAVAIAAGHSFSAVLYDDGTVKASGYPDMTKLLAELKNVVKITTGGNDILLVKTKEGKVIQIPEPSPPEPPPSDPTKEVIE